MTSLSYEMVQFQRSMLSPEQQMSYLHVGSGTFAFDFAHELHEGLCVDFLPDDFVSEQFLFFLEGLQLHKVQLNMTSSYRMLIEPKQFNNDSSAVRDGLLMGDKVGMDGFYLNIRQTMYDQQMDNEDEYASSFEIMINEDCMVSSFVMEEQKIKFPNVDLVVDQHGINKLSDPNTQFDRIKIEPKAIKELQILGKGSAGVVRRAVYELNGKEYVFAVKSINATQQQHRKQLLNDLRSYLSGGYSENLIEFYTCFFHDGLVKQVIEFMDMGALRNIIQLIAVKKLVLSEEEMATIIFKILNGLYYIHDARHSIHRDIKPENILFNSKGEVKITDFGVSKCIEHSTGRSIVGTVTYMSPERLSLSETYTYKCDIWSLGLILFQLATGKPIPYSELGGKFNYFKVCQKIINDQPPTLPPGQFSAEMCDFLKRCLQKKEEERASAQALLNHPWILLKAGKANLRDLVEKVQSIT